MFNSKLVFMINQQIIITSPLSLIESNYDICEWYRQIYYGSKYYLILIINKCIYMYYNFKDVLFAKKNRETKPEKVAIIVILWLVLLETSQRMAHIAKYGSNQKGNRTLLDKNNYSYNLEKKVNDTEFWKCSKWISIRWNYIYI